MIKTEASTKPKLQWAQSEFIENCPMHYVQSPYNTVPILRIKYTAMEDEGEHLPNRWRIEVLGIHRVFISATLQESDRVKKYAESLLKSVVFKLNDIVEKNKIS